MEEMVVPKPMEVMVGMPPHLQLVPVEQMEAMVVVVGMEDAAGMRAIALICKSM